MGGGVLVYIITILIHNIFMGYVMLRVLNCTFTVPTKIVLVSKQLC